MSLVGEEAKKKRGREKQRNQFCYHCRNFVVLTIVALFFCYFLIPYNKKGHVTGVHLDGLNGI